MSVKLDLQYFPFIPYINNKKNIHVLKLAPQTKYFSEDDNGP